VEEEEADGGGRGTWELEVGGGKEKVPRGVMGRGDRRGLWENGGGWKKEKRVEEVGGR
jgi:hypothetical protein